MHPPAVDRKLSVAPMLDWSDRYFRYFLRRLSRRTLLYTEMITTGAILHGDRERYLAFDNSDHPVAIQLGGSDPGALAASARLATQRGFDEVNLNVGCPSNRVQSGRFGACLMADPVLVAELVAAMREAVDIPVTVKHRIGIDDQDDYASLCRFITQVADAGCGTFIIHARKAWLQGLSPRENREIPPLRYPVVRQVKQDFPDLEIIVNGGIMDLHQAAGQLEQVDGVMMGRAIYHNPWLLADADRCIFGATNPLAHRHEAVEAMRPFIEKELAAGTPLQRITRHMLGLFNGQPGARHWRRHLSEYAPSKGAGFEVLLDAMNNVKTAA